MLETKNCIAYDVVMMCHQWRNIQLQFSMSHQSKSMKPLSICSVLSIANYVCQASSVMALNVDFKLIGHGREYVFLWWTAWFESWFHKSLRLASYLFQCRWPCHCWDVPKSLWRWPLHLKWICCFCICFVDSDSWCVRMLQSREPFASTVSHAGWCLHEIL